MLNARYVSGSEYMFGDQLSAITGYSFPFTDSFPDGENHVRRRCPAAHLPGHGLVKTAAAERISDVHCSLPEHRDLRDIFENYTM